MSNIDYIDFLDEASLTPEDESFPSYYAGDKVADHVHDLLAAFGEDPQRDGLLRTPDRVARMYRELLSGYWTDPVKLVNNAVFESDYQDIVMVKDIDFYSMCEHHLLPFYGRIHVAYIPDGRIIGLSKIPRLVEMFSRRLQVQERMTQQIAEGLDAILQPKGVAVVAEGAHLCAIMRGVKKANARMVTRVLLGTFKSDEKLCAELFQQLQRLDPTRQLAESLLNGNLF